MHIRSIQFFKSLTQEDEALDDGTPQIAFIGRSNVGKSSVINSLANQKDLAYTSSRPGSTQVINLFLVNKSHYLVDLPGYGHAHGSREIQGKLQSIISWYLFESHYEQKKVVLIIDAEVGPTENDLDMIYSLREKKKSVVVVANKIDKIKKSFYVAQMQKVQSLIGDVKMIPFSAKKRIGVVELTMEILR